MVRMRPFFANGPPTERRPETVPTLARPATDPNSWRENWRPLRKFADSSYRFAIGAITVEPGCDLCRGCAVDVIQRGRKAWPAISANRSPLVEFSVHSEPPNAKLDSVMSPNETYVREDQRDKA